MIVIDKEKYLKIKNRMLELEITQKQIADYLGTSQQNISVIIRGLSENEEYKKKIEDILKIKIWEKKEKVLNLS